MPPLFKDRSLNRQQLPSSVAQMDNYGSAGQGRIPVKKRLIKKRTNIQNIITDNETSDDNTKAIEQLDMEFANMQKDKYRLDSAINSKDNLQK